MAEHQGVIEYFIHVNMEEKSQTSKCSLGCGRGWPESDKVIANLDHGVAPPLVSETCAKTENNFVHH